MAQAPGSSGFIPLKECDRVSEEGSNPHAENEGDAAVAAVACRTLPGAPEMQPAEVRRADLMWAVRKGRTEIVEALLREGADPNTTGKGATVLMRAALQGRAEIVNMLLDAGADPNIADKRGFTALMAAASWRHAVVVRALLEEGADPSAADEKGRTAIQIVKEDTYLTSREIINLLSSAKELFEAKQRQRESDETELVDIFMSGMGRQGPL